MRHTEHPTSPALPPVPLLLALGDKPEDSVPVSDLWRVVGTVDLHDRDLGPEWAEKTVFLETERDGRRLIAFGWTFPPLSHGKLAKDNSGKTLMASSLFHMMDNNASKAWLFAARRDFVESDGLKLRNGACLVDMIFPTVEGPTTRRLDANYVQRQKHVVVFGKTPWDMNVPGDYEMRLGAVSVFVRESIHKKAVRWATNLRSNPLTTMLAR